MQMPLSLPAADPATLGNPLAIGQIRLPVQLDDPVQVLTNLHTATERLNTERFRDAEKSSTTGDLVSVAPLIPPILVRAGMQLHTRPGLRQSPNRSTSWRRLRENHHAVKAAQLSQK